MGGDSQYRLQLAFLYIINEVILQASFEMPREMKRSCVSCKCSDPAPLIKRIIMITVLLMAGCAYFNTFYNAQHYYREAMKLVANDTLKLDSEFFDKTIEKSTSVIVKYPTSRYVDDALFMMAASYYYKGDYSRALEKLDFLCLNYPKSKFYDDALYYKGLSYYQQEKFGPAVIALNEAKTSKQYMTQARIVLCLVYFKDSSYANLTEVAKELLTERLKSKERRWVLKLLGEAQFNQKLYSDALETHNELLSITRIEEDKRKLKLKIAEIYLEMGEYEKCGEFLEGEAEPEFKSILADLNVKLGNIEKAKNIYLEAATKSRLEISPQAFFKLAELYREEDSLELAIAYYDSSISRAPGSDYGMRAKKMADVLRRIDALLKEIEDKDRAQFLLAEIYFVDFKDPEKAIGAYQKVHREFPQSKWAPKALYAQLWIAHNIIENDSLVNVLAEDLINRYPNSEYAKSAKNLLGERDIESNESKEF
jgi:TolA-binding protein